MKTPTAQLAINGGSQHPDKRKAGGHGPTLADQIEQELPMIPTPSTQNSHGNRTNGQGRRLLPGVADDITMLPTPVAAEGLKAATTQGVEARAATGQVFLTNVIHDIALLPTPLTTDGKTNDSEGANPQMLGSRVHNLDLLPTPLGSDGEKGGPNQRGGSGDLRISSVNALFPTPAAMNPNDAEDLQQWQARRDAVKAERKNGNGFGMPLAIAARLLPTPTTQDKQHTYGDSQKHRNTVPLNTEVLDTTNWGKYEPAIRRAEAIVGRPAPSPVNADGKGGANRLSSRFVEWMMMLPEGWVSGHHLGRNPELERLGNGVVPLQAAYAVRVMVARVFERIEP